MLFIKHHGTVKCVIFTVWPEAFNDNGSIVEGRVYINDLKGTFLDGYRIEGGKFTKRFVINQAEVHRAGFLLFLFQQDDDCWNTDTLDLYSGGVIDEVTLHVSTDENGNSQGGSATGYIGYYSIINGAAIEGNGSQGSNSGGGGINDSGMTSAAGTIITLPPEGCPPGQVKNANDECVTPCNTSKEDLKKVFPNTSDTKLQEIVDAINKYAKDFGIDTKEKLQHFLAQAGHESTNYMGNEFSALEENLNYRWEKLGTKDYWEKYFNPISDPSGNPDKANPYNYRRSENSDFVDVEKFANYVYSDNNRSSRSQLGNNSTGDGFKYRGRGIIQITGKYNYERFNEFYQQNYDENINLVINPNLVSTDMDIAIISALWFFKNKVIDELSINDSTTVESVTKKVNGGYKGLSHRKELLNKAKNNLDCL